LNVYTNIGNIQHVITKLHFATANNEKYTVNLMQLPENVEHLILS